MAQFPESPTSNKGQARFRVLAAALGAFLALATAELGLRAAGWYYYASSGRGERDDISAELVVLCHGDSNVFGIYEPVEESWPAQLERLLAAKSPATSSKVVNLGIPGFAIRQMLTVIEADLEKTRADVLMISIGANDAWNWMPAAEAEYERQVDPPWYENLRIARMLRLGSYGKGHGKLAKHADIELESIDGESIWTIENREGQRIQRRTGALAGSNADEELYLERLREDIGRLQKICDERSVQLVLVCYGSEGSAYGKTNRVFRQTAADLDLPLVDASDDLIQLVRMHGFGAVFFADLHPRGLGYEAIARRCYDSILNLGLVEGEPFAGELQSLQPRVAAAPPMRLVGNLAGEPGTEAEISIAIDSEEPGRKFRVVLYDLHEDGQEPPPRRDHYELLKSDLLYRRTVQADELVGVFDDNGEARIPLTSVLQKRPDLDWSGLRMRVGYLVFTDAEGKVLSRFSDPLIIQLR